MKIRHAGLIAVLAMCLSEGLLGQSAQQIHLDAIENLELGNLKADIVGYLGRACASRTLERKIPDTAKVWRSCGERRSGTARLK